MRVYERGRKCETDRQTVCVGVGGDNRERERESERERERTINEQT